MMTKTYAVLFAVIVGVFLAAQPPINAALGKGISPRTAALHSFLTGTLLLLIMNMLYGDLQHYKNIVNVPFIYWTGGLLGVGIVFFTIKIIPVLGAGAALSIFVAIQLITGLIIDHFGLLGVTRSPIGLLKILGALLVLIGAKLIIK